MNKIVIEVKFNKKLYLAKHFDYSTQVLGCGKTCEEALENMKKFIKQCRKNPHINRKKWYQFWK